MRVIYTQKDFPSTFDSSIFLAGPSPRKSDVESWRPRAIDLLRRSGFTGVIFSPELEGGVPMEGLNPDQYERQVEWEHEAMRRSDVILFWFDAEEKQMPALTTRVEFGLQVHSAKAVFGAPEGAWKSKYIESVAHSAGLRVHRALETLIDEAIEKSDCKADRSGPETLIPAEIFTTRSFQDWYSMQRGAGHELTGVEFAAWIPPSKPEGTVLHALKPWIRIASEDRTKENEIVILRPSIHAVCAYESGASVMASRVVLIREYRAAVMNAECFVYELPSGSSDNEDEPPFDVAIEEFNKETGLQVSANRLRVVQTRQVCATAMAHRVTLYSVELEKSEIEQIESFERSGKTFGDQDVGEVTRPLLMSLEQILGQDLVDAANVGLIAQALMTATRK